VKFLARLDKLMRKVSQENKRRRQRRSGPTIYDG